MSVVAELDTGQLERWIVGQRWFASKSRELSGIEVVEEVALDGADDGTQASIVLVSARLPMSAHDLYQVPIAARPPGQDADAIATAGERVYYDALADPAIAVRLLRSILRSGVVEGEGGRVVFRAASDDPPAEPAGEARPMGVEQSNSSTVFGEELVLKSFRRLEPGPNPELEMLRFLQSHGFANIAPLEGWYEFDGARVDATLGVLQRFLPGARDGWALALAEAGRDTAGFLDVLEDLGRVVGEMHSVLGSDASEPAMAPEEPSPETVALLVATVDDEIEAIFSSLPDDPQLDPIRDRQQDMRERLGEMAHVGASGRLIRTHGDLHLSQALRHEGRWVIVDFEGEPSRPLATRRQKRSPLRDVAGMLRSFAYAASAIRLDGGSLPPEWERGARERFMEGYLGAVDPGLLPAGRELIEKLLAIYELEKSLYELRYELDNRPDWVPIPVASITALLELQ